MAFSLLLTALVLLISTTLTSYLLNSRKDSREPPSLSFPIPLLGHLLSLLRHGAAHLTHLDTSHHSPGIYTLPILNSKFYILNSPSWAVAMHKCHKTLSFNVLASQGMSILFGLNKASTEIVKRDPDAEGSLLVDQHKLMFSAFVEDIQEVNQIFLAEFTKHVNHLSHDGSQTLELWSWLRTSFSLASTAAIFGPKNPLAIYPNLAQDVWVVDDSLEKLIITPLPRIFLSKAFQARLRLWEAFESYAVQGHEKQGSNIAQLYIDSAKDHGLSTAMAGRQTLGLLFAALINTGPVAFWVVSYVFSDPRLLAEVRAEVDGCVSKDTNSKRHTLSISALRSKAPLLWSCMRETMRISATMNINRYVSEDTEISSHSTGESFVLKKGGMVTVAASVMHSCPEIWGDDAATFNPRRFLSKSDASSGDTSKSTGKAQHDPAATFRGADGKLHPGAFRTFGGGNNICPGRQFAANEILAIVGLLVAGFEISMPDGGQYVPPPYEKMKMIAGVHKPAHDVRVSVKRREGYEGVVWGCEM